MAATPLNREGRWEGLLGHQLAVIVRNIRWSYAIFWSISTRQPGVLEWNDGYYNGNIKTRKTTQSTELDPDQWGIQRSLQLRELYVALSAGDSNQQPRRPSVSLSPEDLTDAEWYYLVCMSFTFSHGQGLPGKTLSNGTEIWLCNAHFTDSKIFSRSLLAKSASIQTIVCFPLLSGVIELGTTELVLENAEFIKQLKLSFSELSKSFSCEPSTSSSQKIDEVETKVPSNIDEDKRCAMHSRNLGLVLEHHKWCQNLSPPPIIPSYSPELVQVVAEGNIGEELRTDSPESSSDDCCPSQQDDDSLVMDRRDDASHSWQILVDKFDDNSHVFLKSTDCTSHSFTNLHKVLSSPEGERISCHLLHDLEACNYSKSSSLDPANDDMHYIKTLSSILKVPRREVAAPLFMVDSELSSFTVWRKSLNAPETHSRTRQKLLKKILFNVIGKHNVNHLLTENENCIANRLLKSGLDTSSLNHVMSERIRREKLDEKLIILKSLIASISKVDKTTILKDTIEHIKKIERRVEELNSYRRFTDYGTRGRKGYPDISERTTDNYDINGTINGFLPSMNKRKACDMDDEEAQQHCNKSEDSFADVTVTVIEKEVLIEMESPWRECLLFEIVDAISNLHLDAHSIQSSVVDGRLCLTVKSKFRDLKLVSPGTIKKELYKVVYKH